MPCTPAPHPSPSSLPLAVSEKIVFYSPTASLVPISRYLTSRPQPGSSANTSTAPSLTSCSNTCRTTTDCETQNRAYPTIDLAEMLKTRLSSDMDTLALDRSLVRQAQTWVEFSHRPSLSCEDIDMNEKSSSGELNAKHREILDLHTLAQSRFKATKDNFADGMRAAEEVKRDLNWTQNRISWVDLVILSQALYIVLLARRYATDLRAESSKPKLNASIRLSTEQLRINIVQSLRSKDDKPSALCSPYHPPLPSSPNTKIRSVFLGINQCELLNFAQFMTGHHHISLRIWLAGGERLVAWCLAYLHPIPLRIFVVVCSPMAASRSK